MAAPIRFDVFGRWSNDTDALVRLNAHRTTDGALLASSYVAPGKVVAPFLPEVYEPVDWVAEVA